MGKPVNKAYLLRYIGSEKKRLPQKDPWGNEFIPKWETDAEAIIKKYARVATHYYAADEMFWKYKKKHAYELHKQNSSLQIGHADISYIDYETGAPIGMDDTIQVTYPPKVLMRFLKVDHLEGAGRSVAGGNVNWLIVIMAMGIGLAVGFLIAQNLPAINSLIHPSNQTQVQQFAQPFIEALHP